MGHKNAPSFLPPLLCVFERIKFFLSFHLQNYPLRCIIAVGAT